MDDLDRVIRETFDSVDIDATVERAVEDQLDSIEDTQGQDLPRTTRSEAEDAVFRLKEDAADNLFSRRTFMKLLTGGVAGFGAAAMLPVSVSATQTDRNFGNRPAVSDGGTISVPGDYGSLQEAIDNEVAVIMNGETRINVSRGSIEDEEDIVVPGFVAGTPGGVETGGQLRIYGSNTDVKSINVVGTNGLACPYIRDFYFTGGSDFTDDGSGVVVQGSRSATVKDNTFDGSQDHACVYYTVVGGKVVDNNFGGARYGLRVKRGGYCSMVNCHNANTLVKLSHGFCRVKGSSGNKFNVGAGFGFDHDGNRRVDP